MPAVGNAQPLLVFVSLLLQKTLVEKVGGDHVVVEPLVLPGHNPATYNLTPKQISALANSVLYIRTGVPFENAWMGCIRSANPNMRLLDARLYIDRRNLEQHKHEGESSEHTHNGHDDPAQDDLELDPHVWISPPLVKVIARNSSLTKLIEQAKRERFRIIFVQTQFNQKAAEQVTRAMGGRVVAIDPLSADYVATLRNIAQQITEAQN